MLVFNDAPNVACLICPHLVSGQAAVAHIFHDEDDGMWQFWCDQTHGSQDVRLLGLAEAMQCCQIEEELLNQIPYGYGAHVSASHWHLQKIEKEL